MLDAEWERSGDRRGRWGGLTWGWRLSRRGDRRLRLGGRNINDRATHDDPAKAEAEPKEVCQVRIDMHPLDLCEDSILEPLLARDAHIPEIE